ncbi:MULTISPECIES: hypothetical protein [Pseudonocardia]|uniref:Uncharacterized protein n=2 Tax=Pseudonocardia TaxID=1847 RepID=A0A1Y2MJ74_PSEAH|nr:MULTISPECIES: hypothetical protein [Pseudonocardia]OSY35049.1 hypothetical protein BG845_06362 [Pseudonocardia autotrophica]TDN65584.1 hypothetical protein C8E95_7090 [Pseudonocardia autotrophica]BBG05725.1 hypothetical protein Pdca_69340 [Pseudonocardia autotrophica]GEC28135.1 hypothetical protein PSA01_51640 [Pseudonocardia saturnea]
MTTDHMLGAEPYSTSQERTVARLVGQGGQRRQGEMTALIEQLPGLRAQPERADVPEPAQAGQGSATGEVDMGEPVRRPAGRDATEKAAVDPVRLLIHREQIRHNAELAQTHEQVTALLASPTASLLTALDSDLAAVATAAIEAMAVLRQHQAPERIPDQDEVSGAVGDYLATVARLCRSTLAIHLTLEAQVRSDTS